MSTLKASLTDETPPTPARRLSNLVFASFLCGAVTPIVGFIVLSDAGSDFSDLLTLTIPLFFVSAVVLCILAHVAIGKAPRQLTGTGYAKAGPILAALTIGAGGFLITAT